MCSGSPWGTVAAVGNGWVNWPSFRTLHRDDSTRQAGESLLRDAPPGALVLANWHHATPLWYLQEVDGLREDVEVVYVYPEGATPNEEVWLRRIDEALDERPVIVTNRFYAYEGADLRFVPYHDAWLLRREPLSEPPEAITAHLAAFGEGEGPPFVTLLGYRLSTETPRAGETLDLRVYWRAEGALPRDYSTFAQLLGPGGVVGQGDIGHRSTEYLPGEVRVDAYRIPLLLHATPGSHRLITGFYYPEGDGWQRLMTGGADHLALADLTVEPADRSFATLHPRVDRFSGGLVLRGADADHTIAGETRLYLHLAEAEAAPVARGPWGADAEAVTLQVSGPDGLLAERALPPLAPGAAVTLAVDLLADVGEVRVALRAADGAVLPRLGPWGRAAGDGVTLRLSDEGHYVPLGGEMAFLGMPGLPAEVPAGGEATLRAAFLALRPLTRDYSISVGLARPDLGWEAKADGTPALGAIPTLKWVTGWVVEDQHAVPLGGQAPGGAAPGGAAPPGEAAVTLSVYDAFTLEPLNVLDERLVRQGQGTSLRLDTATVRIE